MSVTAGSIIAPADVAALFSLANTKASLLFANAGYLVSIIGTPYTIPTAATWVDPASPGGAPYALNDMVSWGGTLFKNTVANNTSIPTGTGWAPENNTGAYTNTTSYGLLDVVEYGGYTWISTTTQTGNPPMTAAYGGSPNSGWMQHWLTCYERLRADVQAAASGIWTDLSDGNSVALQVLNRMQAVSGPWPCSPSLALKDILFVFPSNSPGSVSVSLVQTLWVGTSGKAVGMPCTWGYTEVDTYAADSANPGGYGSVSAASQYPTTCTYEMWIGGAEAALLSGTFTIFVHLDQGATFDSSGTPTSDGSNPAALASIDDSGWIPGAGSWVADVTVPPVVGTVGYMTFTSTISTPISVPPGRYTITFTGQAASKQLVWTSGSPAPTIFASSAAYVRADGGNDPYCAILSDVGPSGAEVVAAVTVDTVSSAPGIHDTESVWQIPAPTINSSSGLPWGVDCYRYSASATSLAACATAGWGTLFLVDSSYVLYAPSILPRNSGATAFPGIGGFYQNGDGIDGAGFGPEPGYSGSVPGVWTALIPPVDVLTFGPQSQMPWNQFTVTGTDPNEQVVFPPASLPPWTCIVKAVVGPPVYKVEDITIKYAPPLETQIVPQSWAAATQYPLGYIIVDSNGNWQKFTSGSITGVTAPTWNTTMGGTTSDNYVVSPPTFAPAIWTMVPQLGKTAFQSTQARMYSVPSYPVIWSSDTWQANHPYSHGALILDTNGDIRVCTQAGGSGSTQPAWIAGRAIGGGQNPVNDGSMVWNLYMQNIGAGNRTGTGTAGFTGGWIYGIALNRIGTGFGTAGSITAQIGCLRNTGSGYAFVSFGTFTTGTPATVLWPIFTNSPLVYVCSERLDVEASFFTNIPSPWGAVGFPILASYLSDLTAILNLMA